MCIDCDCGGLREREREHDERVRVRETAERERYTYRAEREKKHKQFSINFACGLRRLRLPHLAADCAPRERGEGVRESERTQHSSGSREKQTIIIYYLCINSIAEAAAKAITSRLMARLESTKRKD